MNREIVDPEYRAPTIRANRDRKQFLIDGEPHDAKQLDVIVLTATEIFMDITKFPDAQPGNRRHLYVLMNSEIYSVFVGPAGFEDWLAFVEYCIDNNKAYWEVSARLSIIKKQAGGNRWSWNSIQFDALGPVQSMAITTVVRARDLLVERDRNVAMAREQAEAATLKAEMVKKIERSRLE